MSVKPKYPARLFAFNMVLHFFLRYWYLLLPGVVLCLVGIWVRMCLALGVTFLGADLAVSLIDQVRIRRASLDDPTDDAYTEMMDAALESGDPEAFRKVVQEKITPRPREMTKEEPRQEHIRHPYE